MPERRPHLPAFRTRPRCCTSIAGLIYAVGGLNSAGTLHSACAERGSGSVGEDAPDTQLGPSCPLLACQLPSQIYVIVLQLEQVGVNATDPAWELKRPLETLVV